MQYLPRPGVNTETTPVKQNLKTVALLAAAKEVWSRESSTG